MRRRLLILLLAIPFTFVGVAAQSLPSGEIKIHRLPSGKVEVLGIGPAKEKKPVQVAKADIEAGQLLTLPAEITADVEDVWLDIEAKLAGEGEIRWLTQPKVKSRVINPTTLQVDVTKPGKFQVIAVAMVGQKLSPFVTTTVTVTGSTPKAAPPPGAGTAAPPMAAGKQYVTVIIDLATATQAEQQFAYSQGLRAAVKQAGATFNVFVAGDPALQPPSAQNPKGTGLIAFFRQTGGPCVVCVQDDRGDVKKAVRLPATEAAVLELLK